MMKTLLRAEVVIIALVIVAGGLYANFVYPRYYYPSDFGWAYTTVRFNDGTTLTSFDHPNHTLYVSNPNDVLSYEHIKRNQSVEAIIDGTTHDGVQANFKFTLYFEFRTEDSITRPEVNDHIKQLRTALIGQMGQYVGKLDWTEFKHDGGRIWGMDNKSESLRDAVNRLGVHWDGTIVVTPLAGRLPDSK